MAALLAALNGRLPSRLGALLAIATAVATGGVCLSLIVLTRLDPLVYWFGGWTPRNGVAPGIGFAIDVYGATLAFLACLLVTAALIFSSRYFDTVGNIYHVLMLSFLAAMCGFCLTGDLFNLFVFFELMSAAAFALCGYKSEEAGPLEGTLNFAVTNTIGAFLALTGIALLYGRTGALNLAQIGRALAPAPDGLVLAAFVFITAGFLVKAAVAPFHFWLADAHAVAPTPVCILFSGVMVELGLYAVARVYWTVFSGPLALQTGNLRNIFIGAGVLTALLGGLLCFLQRHIKRLLAFSTISHMGLMLIGFGLLTPDALAGTAVYVFSHGLVKAALFIGAGILLHRAGTVDEFELKGRGRHMPAAGAIFVLGGLGLAGLPPFGTFTGEHLIDHAAGELGYGWLGWVGTAVAVLTSGAVLRVAGRVFAGWGPSHEVLGVPGLEDPGETRNARRSAPHPAGHESAGGGAAGVRAGGGVRTVAGGIRAPRGGLLCPSRGLRGAGAGRHLAHAPTARAKFPRARWIT